MNTTAILLVYLWFLLQNTGAWTPEALAIWLLLLVGVLLGIKTFAFAPVSDNLGLWVLFSPVLAAAVLVSCIKRWQRVRQTFIPP